MGQGIDRLTILVMLVIVGAIVEVLSPGTITRLVHDAARQLGLP